MTGAHRAKWRNLKTYIKAFGIYSKNEYNKRVKNQVLSKLKKEKV